MTARAITALNATSRWAVTGTPVQNYLADLSGLLKFLKFIPYDDPKTLDKQVLAYLQRGDPKEGIERLQKLCHAIMIRRPASIMHLPLLEHRNKVVDFSPEERWWYQEVESSLQRISNEATEAHAGHSKVWMTVIQLINKLRLLCNLGLKSRSASSLLGTQEGYNPISPEREDSPSEMLAAELALGGVDCVECGSMVSVPDRVNVEDSDAVAYYSACRKVFCSNCAALSQNQAPPICSCSSSTVCTLLPLRRTMLGGDRNEMVDDDGDGQLSSKVDAVIREIKEALPEKRYVKVCF
jgi:hypothetical protein